MWLFRTCARVIPQPGSLSPKLFYRAGGGFKPFLRTYFSNSLVRIGEASYLRVRFLKVGRLPENDAEIFSQKFSN